MTYIAEQDQFLARIGHITIERWFAPKTNIKKFLVRTHLKLESLIEFDVLDRRERDVQRYLACHANKPVPPFAWAWAELEILVECPYSS